MRKFTEGRAGKLVALGAIALFASLAGTASAQVEEDAQPQAGILEIVDPSMISIDAAQLPQLSLEVLEESLVKVNIDSLAIARVEVGRGGVVQPIALQLLPDVVVQVAIDQVEPTASGFALSGQVVSPMGEELGSAVLVVAGDMIAGTIRTIGTIYEIRPTAVNEIHQVVAIDPAIVPEGKSPIADISIDPSVISPIIVEGQNIKPTDQVEDGTIVDIVVAYTPAVKAALGSEQAIRTTIELMVAEANKAYRDSQIVQKLNLVQTIEVEYQEQGSIRQDLQSLISPVDEKLDVVHQLRQQVAADIVHLIVDRSQVESQIEISSLAELLPNISVENQKIAFSVSDYQASGIAFTQATAIPMGVAINDAIQPIPAEIAAEIAQGYVNAQAFIGEPSVAEQWRTIMTTNAQCQAAGFGCQQLLRFANAEQLYKGQPLGIAEISPVTGQPIPVEGMIDVRSRLNQVRQVVANFLVSPALQPGQLVSLQANNGQYVTAAEQQVRADKAQVANTEQFAIESLTGKPELVSGDLVALKSAQDLYLSAINGALDVVSTTVGQMEKFTLHRIVAGQLQPEGVIRSGDSIALETQAGTFIVAEQGGSAIVMADRLSAGLWETFKITKDPQQPILNAVVDVVPSVLLRETVIGQPIQVPVDKPVVLNGLRSTGQIQSYAWETQDGAQYVGAQVEHVFPASILEGVASKLVDVELTVQDQLGNIDVALVQVLLVNDAENVVAPIRQLQAQFRTLSPNQQGQFVQTQQACTINLFSPDQAICQFDASISPTAQFTNVWTWQVNDVLSPLQIQGTQSSIQHIFACNVSVPVDQRSRQVQVQLTVEGPDATPATQQILVDVCAVR